MTLEETLKAIQSPDKEAMRQCQARWDSIAKPLQQPWEKWKIT